MNPAQGSLSLRSLALGGVAFAAYAVGVATGVVPHALAIDVSAATAAMPFLTAWAARRAAKRHEGRTRRGWQWIAAVLLGLGLYNIAWYALLYAGIPAPAVMSFGFLAFIPFGMVGILNLAVLRDRSSTLRRAADAFFISGSLFVVSWSLLLRTLYLSSSGSVATRVAAISYPISDIIILSLIVFLATRYRSDGTTPLSYIALSLAVWSVSDSAYAYVLMTGAYKAGHPVEAGWLAGYILLLLGTVRAKPVEDREEDEAEGQELPRVVLPYAVGALALVVGIASQVVRGMVDPVVLYGVIVLAILALARQFLAVVEHQRVTIARLRMIDETKTNILRAVSHELRTPLTFIKGTSQFLSQEWQTMSVNTVDELFGRVTANCDRLDDLLGSLLDLERLSRGVIEPARQRTDIRDLLDRVAESVQRFGHVLIILGDNVEANVDPSQIERIVENLIINAVRHTPRGTRIIARCARVDEGVLITVSDNGPGIPAELRASIFDPFVQNETSATASRGTGIGLSLVAKFTQLHGGRAWVEENESGGARFAVLLPDPSGGGRTSIAA